MDAIKTVVAVVAEHFGITPEQLRAGGQHRGQRRIACYLGHTFTSCSLPQIGRACGPIDHSNVVLAVRLVLAELADNPMVGGQIAELNEPLRVRGLVARYEHRPVGVELREKKTPPVA